MSVKVNQGHGYNMINPTNCQHLPNCPICHTLSNLRALNHTFIQPEEPFPPKPPTSTYQNANHSNT